jgi:AraC-like DNA-binding protein/uncharacterized cupin superfamily protein
MVEVPAAARDWSLFDLEVPAAGRIEYPLHIGVWEAAEPGLLTMDVHQGMEIGFVLQGKVERHYEDLTFTASPGDMHLCSAWEPHGWRVSEPDTVSVVFIFLAEVMDDEAMRGVPWLSFFTVPPGQRPRTSSAEMRREILTLGRIIRHEAEDKPRGWMAVVRLFLFYLLLIVNRHWEQHEVPGLRRSVPASSFARVMPAVTLVHDNPERDIAVAKAATACDLHRSRFSSIFRQTMGVSFTQFHRRARLARVAHLLITTDLPTEAIAEETGFVDGSHLHRTFVQYYNCTPGQYRSQHRPG